MNKILYTNSIYTVNSLPHWILNYILNFGSFSCENEKKYKESIESEIIETSIQKIKKNINTNILYTPYIKRSFIRWGKKAKNNSKEKCF